MMLTNRISHVVVVCFFFVHISLTYIYTRTQTHTVHKNVHGIQTFITFDLCSNTIECWDCQGVVVRLCIHTSARRVLHACGRMESRHCRLTADLSYAWMRDVTHPAWALICLQDVTKMVSQGREPVSWSNHDYIPECVQDCSHKAPSHFWHRPTIATTAQDCYHKALSQF